MRAPLRIGLPKGRVLDEAKALFERASLSLATLENEPRRLVHPVEVEGLGQIELLVLRAKDVPAYVEHGACDIGIAGYDVIVEQRPDVLVPLDLGIGRCRMTLAARPEVDPLALETPRIATNYPHIAAELFFERGAPAQIITLSGAVEIAPLVGLADGIVDIVETGETLRRNGLVEKQTLFDVSARLVINRAALHLRMKEVRTIQDMLHATVGASGSATP